MLLQHVFTALAIFVGHNQNGEYFMFLMRMCLGDIFITQSEKINYIRPPCRQCSSTRCSQHPQTFDSVVADGGSFSHREFVVYDRAQCYPEYVITYKAWTFAKFCYVIFCESEKRFMVVWCCFMEQNSIKRDLLSYITCYNVVQLHVTVVTVVNTTAIKQWRFSKQNMN